MQVLGTELWSSSTATMPRRAPALLTYLFGFERVSKAALCHRFPALGHSLGDWFTLSPVSFPLHQWPVGGDQTSFGKPLAVPALTPMFLSLQIDFSADQIEGECEQLHVLFRFPEKDQWSLW